MAWAKGISVPATRRPGRVHPHDPADGRRQVALLSPLGGATTPQGAPTDARSSAVWTTWRQARVPYFMLKEIHEQPETASLGGAPSAPGLPAEPVALPMEDAFYAGVGRIQIGLRHRPPAAMVGAYLLEQYAGFLRRCTTPVNSACAAAAGPTPSPLGDPVR